MEKEINLDYISELPDEIISHIIYFLPVADAFALKLLSRRFKRIQVYLRNLYFCKQTIFGIYEGSKPCSQFVEKVDSFLKLFKGPYLDEFIVEFPLDQEFSSVIDDWIRFAIFNDAESIELDFWRPDAENLYKFPFHLLPNPKLCSRLKRLKLGKCSLDYCSASFNCLKTIELESLPLDQTDLDALLSSCVNLEWLTIDHCLTPHVLRVCSARLRGLCIRPCWHRIIVELDATQLHTFEYYSKSLEDLIFLSDVPLKTVKLGLFCAKVDLFYTMLGKVLPELQSLSLGWCSWKHVPATVPEFGSLKQLHFFQPQYQNFDYFSVINIINVCPKLQKLHVDMQPMAHIKTVSKPEKVVLNSKTTKYFNLEEIEISAFGGSSRQMKFVKHLLKNAINLKHIALVYSRYESIYDDGLNVNDTQFLERMSRKKQFFHDSLRKEMTSREANAVIY